MTTTITLLTTIALNTTPSYPPPPHLSDGVRISTFTLDIILRTLSNRLSGSSPALPTTPHSLGGTDNVAAIVRVSLRAWGNILLVVSEIMGL